MNDSNLNIELTPWSDLPPHCQDGMVKIVIKTMAQQLFSEWQLTRRFNSLGENISFEEFVEETLRRNHA
jgi:hypothetical protein